jgi:hypothetical protein
MAQSRGGTYDLTCSRNREANGRLMALKSRPELDWSSYLLLALHLIALGISDGPFPFKLLPLQCLRWFVRVRQTIIK